MQEKRYLPPIAAARRLGIGLDYVYKQIWAGKMPGKKIKGRWRIPLVAVEQRLKERESRNA
jgi:excisionase family DNA binding protein